MKINTICVSEIAKICHQANKAYCEIIGDNSQPEWDNLQDILRDSVVDGVFSIISSPDLSAEQSHENWCKYKDNEGWVYGPVKNVVLRKHPCMVPYNQLPEEQKVKDELFRSIVRVFLT